MVCGGGLSFQFAFLYPPTDRKAPVIVSIQMICRMGVIYNLGGASRCQGWSLEGGYFKGFQQDFDLAGELADAASSNVDELVKSPKSSFSVIPEKAGIRSFQRVIGGPDTDPGSTGVTTFYEFIKFN